MFVSILVNIKIVPKSFQKLTVIKSFYVNDYLTRFVKLHHEDEHLVGQMSIN